MSKYFRVDGDLIHFENTSSLAKEINEIISRVRKAAKELPQIGPEAYHFIKRKTPGPTMVKIGVKLALRGNTFNYRTLIFKSTGKGMLGGYVTRKINRKLNNLISNEIRNKVDSILGNYIAMFILNELKNLKLSGSLKTTAADFINGAIMTKIAERMG